MTLILPQLGSKLAQATAANNFVPCQSAQLSVSNAGVSGSQSVTFGIVPNATNRTTFKITNSGSKGCYVTVGLAADSPTAVVSTSTPAPTTGTASSTCDYVAAGAILTQDYPVGSDTLAAICAGSDTTILELSIGLGQ